MTSTTETGALAYRRVLIVEDEYFLADDLAQALRRLGAEVIGPVPTQAQALALLAISGIPIELPGLAWIVGTLGFGPSKQ